MSDAPQGTVTLLFTDIEGSTELLQQVGERYADLLAQHCHRLRQAAQAHHGYEVDTQGDSFLFAFARAQDAVLAAVDAQRALVDGGRKTEDGGETAEGSRQQAAGSRDLGSSVSIRVRMGLHTGEPQWTGDRYVGLDLHRGARIMAAGHGGQVLLSQTTYELVQSDLPAGVTLRDMGLHRLKDLRRPRQLYQVVIEGLPDEFPPLKTLDARPNNLPTSLTRLIGREVETQQVGSLLRRPDVHLVTLTGPGGIGKTALALTVAAEVLDQFPDGVFFVSLAPIHDPAHVLSAIAQALNIREQGSQPLRESLVTHLRSRRVLLILDNFEHVVAAAPLALELLSASPSLKVLCTNQVILHVRAEHEFPVAPLPLPPRADGGRQTADGGDTDYAVRNTQYASRIAHYPSVELFVQRAQDVRPDFALTPAVAEPVADICRRLEGVPLAIELAAARVKVLPPPALLARLERRLPLLTGGARDLPARQRTLRATIDWSYNLLADAEKTLFRRLAVFVGGCTLDAVETVCWLDEGDVADALDRLGSLVDKSLLRSQEEGDVPCFVMLETIREYAREQMLASGEWESLVLEHARYFTALAERLNGTLQGPDQTASLAELEREHDNLRAVLRRSLQRGDGLLAAHLGSLLARFWYMRGYLSEGRGWLEQALARLPTPPDPRAGSPTEREPVRVRARAAYSAAYLAFHQGDNTGSLALNQESLRLARALEDAPCTADVLHNLGNVALRQGDYPQAQAHFQESLALRRRLGDKAGVGASVTNLGIVASYQGDYTSAAEAYAEGIAVARALGDKHGLATRLNNLGYLTLTQQDYPRSKAIFEESLTLSRELGDKQGMALLLNNLADVAALLGQSGEALDLCSQSLTLYQEVGDELGVAYLLETGAEILVGQGKGRRAALLWGASEAIRERLQVPRTPDLQSRYDEIYAAMWAQLGDEGLRQVIDLGRTQPLNSVVDHLRP